MESIKKTFMNRTVGFYIGLAAAVVALVSNVVFIIVGLGDRTFSLLTFFFIILGAGTEAIVVFTDWKFAPALPAIFFSVALGRHFYLAAFPLADLVTKIDFFGGKIAVAIGFSAIFGVCTIAAVASSFMSQRKMQKR
jgi:hypothetical protein